MVVDPAGGCGGSKRTTTAVGKRKREAAVAGEGFAGAHHWHRVVGRRCIGRGKEGGDARVVGSTA